MKNNQIFKLIFLFSISTSAFSAGVINFTGELVAGTCTATAAKNGATGTTNPTIILPTVNTAALGTAGNTAGKTAFQITLSGSGCTSGTAPTTITATPFFSYETAQVNTDGRVINTSSSTAGTVDIQILNNAHAVIDLTISPIDQRLSAGTVVSSDLVYQYYAQYYAKGAATAGSVIGSLNYNIFYK